MTLWEGLLGPLSDLGHSLTPCLPCGLLETRSTCLFPRDLFYCYHCAPFPTQRVLYLAVGEVRTPQRPLCFNMTLFCARPCGVIALSVSCISAVSTVFSCPAPSSCCV